jgi:hypothetical protein
MSIKLSSLIVMFEHLSKVYCRKSHKQVKRAKFNKYTSWEIIIFSEQNCLQHIILRNHGLVVRAEDSRGRGFEPRRGKRKII